MECLTTEEVEDLYRDLVCDVQGVINARLGYVTTTQRARAATAALGSVVAIFLAQPDGDRGLLDRSIRVVMSQLQSNPAFNAGVESAQAGREVDPELELDARAISDAINSDEKSEHGPHNCLGCAIQDTIVRFHGAEIRDPEVVMAIFDALASVAARLISDAGVGGSLYFAASLQAAMDVTRQARSTEGMTKQ